MTSLAIKVLQKLESQHLIKLHKKSNTIEKENPIAKLKGAMAKQPIEEIEAQLKELRDSWQYCN